LTTKVIELPDYSKRDDINFAHIDSYIPTAPGIWRLYISTRMLLASL